MEEGEPQCLRDAAPMAAGERLDALLLEHELAAPIAQIPGEACWQREQNGDDAAAADGGGEDRRAELGIPRHLSAQHARPSLVRRVALDIAAVLG